MRDCAGSDSRAHASPHGGCDNRSDNSAHGCTDNAADGGSDSPTNGLPNATTPNGNTCAGRYRTPFPTGRDGPWDG